MDLNDLQLISLKNQVDQNTASLGEKANQISTNTADILLKANQSYVDTQKARIDSLVQTSSGSFYEECLQTDTGALLVVESGATTGQINLASVTPVATGYTPAVNDYVRLVYGVASGSAELIDLRGSESVATDRINNIENCNRIIDSFLFSSQMNNIDKVNIDKCYDSTTDFMHGAVLLKYDVTSFTGDMALNINYDIISLNSIIYKIQTKQRTTGGTLVSSSFVTGLLSKKLTSISYSATCTKTNNTLEIYIYPVVNTKDISFSYLLRNISVKVGTTELTLLSKEIFQVTGTIDSNSSVTTKDISSVLQSLGYTSDLVTSPLYQKTLLVIGDSISDSNASYCSKHYYQHLYEKDSLNYIMDGRSGTGYTLGYSGQLSIPSRIDAYTGYNPDFISIFAGTNDWWAGGKPIGAKGDSTTSTFYGCLKITFDKLINKYPNAKVLIATPIHRLIETGNNSNGESLKQYCDAIIDMAHMYSFSTIDLYNEGGVNPTITISQQTYFYYNGSYYDGTHLNDAGQLRLYPKFKQGLLKS